MPTDLPPTLRDAPSAAVEDSGAGDLDYTLRPRPFSPTLRLQAGPTGLTVTKGGREWRMPWQDIARVRLTYSPTNLTHHAFSCTIGGHGRAMTFGSVSWKSITELERRDGAYLAFVTAFCALAARHNPAIRFEAGLPRWKHVLAAGTGLAVTIALAAASIALASAGAWIATALAVAFTASFAWFAIRHVRNNAPAPFRPEALPARVLP